MLGSSIGVGLVIVMLLAEVDLTRDFGKRLERGPVILGERMGNADRASGVGLAVDLAESRLWFAATAIEPVDVKGYARIDPLGLGDGGTGFGDVVLEGLDATFGEVCTAGFAGMAVSIAVVIQLRPPLEIVQDQRIRTTPHRRDGECNSIEGMTMEHSQV